MVLEEHKVDQVDQVVVAEDLVQEILMGQQEQLILVVVAVVEKILEVMVEMVVLV